MFLAAKKPECSVAFLSGIVLILLSAIAQGQQAANPINPADRLPRVNALIDQGKVQEALALLDELRRQVPGAQGIESLLGKAYYQKRDYSQAVSHLELALKENPNDGESTQLLGLSYYLLGKKVQALPLLEKVQSWLPHPDVTASYLLGVSYLQTNENDKARAAFARMFSVPEDSARAYVVLGQMMLRQQLDEKAVPELERAVALDPRIPMAHFLLGEIYLFKSNIQKALDEFNKELEFNPILWLVYWRMGDAYARLEKWIEAERALKQSIWLNQNFTGPYIVLGKVELRKGDAALAAGYLERAAKMDPKNAQTHYLLGSAYQALGRAKDASREFNLNRTLRMEQDSHTPTLSDPASRP